MQKGKPTVIIEVTKTDFKTEDGRSYPHPIPFTQGNVPTVAEFQLLYDHWRKVYLTGTQKKDTQDGE